RSAATGSSAWQYARKADRRIVDHAAVPLQLSGDGTTGLGRGADPLHRRADRSRGPIALSDFLSRALRLPRSLRGAHFRGRDGALRAALLERVRALHPARRAGHQSVARDAGLRDVAFERPHRTAIRKSAWNTASTT